MHAFDLTTAISARWLPRLLLAMTLALAGVVSWRIHQEHATAGVAEAEAASAAPASDPAPRPGTAGDKAQAGAAATHPAAPPAVQPNTATFLAGAEQRARDAERARREPSLLGLVGELRQRSLQGDASAAAVMEDVLARCATHAELQGQGIDDALLESLLADMGYQPAVASRLASEAGLARTRCATLGPATAGEWHAMGEAWRARAAQLGDPRARFLRPQAGNDTTPAARARHEAEVQQAALEMFAERGPQALIDEAYVLAGRSRYQAEAFVLAGCELLPACAADRAAYIDAHVSLDDLYRMGGLMPLQLLSPREQMIASAQATEIVRQWRAGDLLGLVRRVEAAAPGKP